LLKEDKVLQTMRKKRKQRKTTIMVEIKRGVSGTVIIGVEVESVRGAQGVEAEIESVGQEVEVEIGNVRKEVKVGIENVIQEAEAGTDVAGAEVEAVIVVGMIVEARMVL
jgi:hypothetical protein